MMYGNMYRVLLTREAYLNLGVQHFHKELVIEAG